jgi:DNA repair protein RadD
MQEHLFSPSEKPLWTHQEFSINSIVEAVREGHKRIVLQLPTGGGKTRIAAELIRRGLAKGSRPMFTAPAISLIDQTYESFVAEGIRDIGIMQGSHPATNANAAVQIASIHTLVKRSIPNVSFVFVDEVHESRDDFDAILDSPEWANKVVIGLSATPWKRGMGLRWKKLIVGATIRDLIAAGRLCPFTVYAPEHQVDRKSLTVVSGEFQEGSSADAMSESAIVGDVVKEWREKWGQGKTFMFCVNRKHAKEQMDCFRDSGIPCGYIDAFTERNDRKRIFHQLGYGEIAAIASVRCLVRGVDEDVRCILDTQPTRSEEAHVQKIGRGLRTAKGKDRLVIIDPAGNSLSLGLVTDIFYDHLDEHEPGDRAETYRESLKPAKPAQCPTCRAIVPPGLRDCPICRTHIGVRSNVKRVDGRLVEVVPMPAKKKAELQRWYSAFLWQARKSGMKDGWAAYKFRDKFGIWPDGLRVAGRKPPEDIRKELYQQRKAYLDQKQKATA